MEEKGGTTQAINIDSEFKTLIPPLTDDEYKRLEQSILDEGLREPIITWNGTIIDGHNRYSICTKHGLQCPYTEREFESRDAAKIWIIENQFGRRNLSKYDRGVLALKLEPLYAAESKRRQKLSQGRGVKGSQNSDNLNEPIRTDEQLAKLAGMSRDTIRKVKVIEQEAEKGNETAIKARDELTSGNKNSIHGAFLMVAGKQQPRKRKDTITDDGRRICAICGEPIDEGDSSSDHKTYHIECRREYQREWKRDYRDADRDLRENVAVYTVLSLMAELTASAKSLHDSWAQSIEINESMGVKLTAAEKNQLEKAANNLIETTEKIRKGKEDERKVYTV